MTYNMLLAVALVAGDLKVAPARPALAGAPGTAGMQFLKFSGSARTLAMAEAVATANEEAAAAFANPASLAGLQNVEITAMHHDGPAGLKQEALAAGWAVGPSDSLAASAVLATYGSIPGYDILNRPTGDITAWDGAFGVTWARTLTNGLAAGATVRGIRRALADARATGVSVDLGLRASRPTALGTLLGAAAVRHLGPQTRFDRADDPLPTEWQVGSGLRRLLFGNPLWVTAEWAKATDDDGRARVGAEYRVQEWLSLRAGWVSRDDLASGWRAGLGIGHESFSLDYAALPGGAPGWSHRASLTLRFGQSAREKRMARLRQLMEAFGTTPPSSRPVSLPAAVATPAPPPPLAPPPPPPKAAVTSPPPRPTPMTPGMAAKADEYNREGLRAYALGRLDEARRWWSLALKMNPQHRGARVNLDRLTSDRRAE